MILLSCKKDVLIQLFIYIYYSHTLTMTCAVITLHTIAFSTRVIRFVLELFEMCPRVYVDMLFSLKDIRFAL